MIRFFCGFLLILQVCNASAPDSLRIATWNVQNYLQQNRYIHGKYRLQYPKPEVQKAGLRDLLLKARPDILCLQEMGSEAFLLELQADLAACGLAYGHHHWAQSPGARTGLAILSRIPLDSVIFHDPVPVASGLVMDSMPRGIQEARFSLDGHSFRLFHLHVKSRFSSDPSDPDSRNFRAAELSAITAFLDQMLARYAGTEGLLLAGDFNTPFSSPLLDPLRDGWIPLPATDPAGQDWTYHFHKTQAREPIDGFWIPAHSYPFPLSARILPAPQPPPSDHRLVLLNVSFTLPSP